MRSWQRAFLGILLVGAVAVAGIALNFTLLRLTQDAHDPVGKLSPRAVFSGQTETANVPTRTTTTNGDDGRAPGVVEQMPKDGDADD